MKNRFAAWMLALPCLALSIPSFAGVIFDSGPTNGSSNAYFIDGPSGSTFNQWLANEFVATGSGIVGELEVGLWVPAGSTPATLTWWLGTTYLDNSIAGGTANLAPADYSFLFSNGLGYDIYNVTLTGLTSSMLNAGSTYWLTLGNANDNLGSETVAWDENGGPANCNFGVGNSFFGICGGNGSESFTLSTSSAAAPAPGSLVLLATGMLGLASIRGRKIKL